MAETISTPSTLNGPTSIDTDTNGIYSTSGSSSNLGHAIEYQVDWGDSNFSSWSSGGTYSHTHQYEVSGTYYARVHSRCTTHTSVLSNWSPALAISVTPAPRAVVFNAWWTDKVDNDDDGYVRSAVLRWDPDVNGSGAIQVFEKVYYQVLGAGSWTLITTTNAHTISGTTTADEQSRANLGNVHNRYNWKIEIYRSGQSTPDYTRNSTNDGDLYDFWWELSAED